MQNTKKSYSYRKTSKSRHRLTISDDIQNNKSIKYFFCGFGKMFLISLLFYRSFIICFLISTVYGGLNVGREIKKQNEIWKWKLNLEFKELMLSMSAALSAGYSIENSIKESGKDLKLLYGNKSTILPETEKMIAAIENSRPIEKAISEFAINCDIEDINCFADIFEIARKTGGNMVQIVRSTAGKISGKIEVKREIKTMIAAKKMESRIMNTVPLLIIVYFWLTSPGFLDCLYTLNGHIFMTGLFLMYLFGCMLSERISDIKV